MKRFVAFAVMVVSCGVEAGIRSDDLPSRDRVALLVDKTSKDVFVSGWDDDGDGVRDDLGHVIGELTQDNVQRQALIGLVRAIEMQWNARDLTGIEWDRASYIYPDAYQCFRHRYRAEPKAVVETTYQRVVQAFANTPQRRKAYEAAEFGVGVVPYDKPAGNVACLRGEYRVQKGFVPRDMLPSGLR